MTVACFAPDDSAFGQLMAALGKEFVDCERFPSEAALLRACHYRNFDLIVADPESDAEARKRFFSWLGCRDERGTPVMLWARTRDTDYMTAALEAGVDDVLCADMRPGEMVARVRAVLRRYDHRLARRTQIELAGFKLDRHTSVCYDGDRIVDLTPREFAMAWLLFCNLDHYVTRQTISTSLWGADEEITGRTIEQHIYKLRKKLNLGAERGILIRTAYAQGYRLELCREVPQARPRAPKPDWSDMPLLPAWPVFQPHGGMAAAA